MKTFLVVNFHDKDILEYTSLDALRSAVAYLHEAGQEFKVIEGTELDVSVNTEQVVTFGSETEPKKRRGRPKGSKNKPKVVPVETVLPGQLGIPETGVDDVPVNGERL